MDDDKPGPGMSFIDLLLPALQGGGSRAASEGCALPSRGLAGAVGRHAAGPVEQREIDVFLGQYGQQVAERGQDREADAPAFAVVGAEKGDPPEDVGRTGNTERCGGRMPYGASGPVAPSRAQGRALSQREI